jgi:formylglycine-generating enzyme required for sulfatase activity
LRSALVQVRDKVDDQAKRLNHEQRPSVVDDLRGNFYFFAPVAHASSGAAAPAVRVQSAEEIEQQAWDAAQQANTAVALNAYLAEYPRGRFASAARVKMAGLAVAPAATAPAAATTAAEPKSAGQIFKDCADCPEMVVIPEGSFMIGSSIQERSLANAAGLPAQLTNLEKDGFRMSIARFALAQTSVTKAQFARFAQATGYRTDAEKAGSCYIVEDKVIDKVGAFWRSPGFYQGDTEPVVCVSWNDAIAYIQWINSQVGGNLYSLPSEAQREYATRAGTSTMFYTGNTISTQQANFNGNATFNGSTKGVYRRKTTPVKSFPLNPFGLADMHGNVWEWTQDCYHPSHQGASSDGRAREAGDCSSRVLRGVSWNDAPAALRSAHRNSNSPGLRSNSVGFRLARTL